MPLIDNRKIIKNEIDYDKLAQTIANTTSSNIDYDKLSVAIVNASKAYEIEEQQKRESNLKEFKNKYKITDDDKKGIIYVLRCIQAFLEYDQKQSEVPVMTFELMKEISAFIILVIEVLLIAFGFFIISYTAFKIPNILDRIVDSILGLIVVLFSCFFRIARLEVFAMKDKERINIVFSAIMASIAALFTFLAFIRG